MSIFVKIGQCFGVNLSRSNAWNLKHVVFLLAFIVTLTMMYQNVSTKAETKMAPADFNDPLIMLKPLEKVKETWSMLHKTTEKDETITEVGQEYKILWYNPPHYIEVREEAKYVGFSKCKYSNCKMSFNKTDLARSDAVIIDGRFAKADMKLKRPLGQIWIFAAHECPMEYKIPTGNQWRQEPWKGAYNWTMTYNKYVADIVLPYGVFKKLKTPKATFGENYEMRASLKKENALMITSHCNVQSKRLEYVKKLKQFYNVTILGSCGQKWKCGRAHIHNDCFELLNEYKYYLAFENALCRQYFTEKLFDNFKYDTVLIARGGHPGEAAQFAPEGTFISADDFSSPKELADYLKQLSNSDYAKMLEKKDQYYSPGYQEPYGNAMCDICERMNNVEKYQKIIPDIGKATIDVVQCVKPTDL